MSDITYTQSGDTLTFYEDFTAPATPGYRIVWRKTSESPTPRAEVVHVYPGVDGKEIVDGGDRGRTIGVTGIIFATSEANLKTAMDLIRAKKNANDGTLVVFGESMANTDLADHSFAPVVRGTYFMRAFVCRFRTLE